MGDRKEEIVIAVISGQPIEAGHLDEFEVLLASEEDEFIKEHAAITMASGLLIRKFDLPRAERLCRNLIDTQHRAEILGLLGNIRLAQGDVAGAKALHEQAALLQPGRT